MVLLIPPIVFLSLFTTSMPSRPLPSTMLPVLSVPMKLPWIVLLDEPAVRPMP